MRHTDPKAKLNRRRPTTPFSSDRLVVAFSPDGSRTLVCAWGGNVAVRETISLKPISTLVGHVVGVLAAAFSPDGSRVATACDDGFVRLWDSETGRFISSQSLDIDSRVRLDFLRDGVRIAFSCRDGAVRIWDSSGLGEVADVVAKPALRLDQVGFLDADKVAIFESGSWRQVWDVRSWWGVSADTVPDTPTGSVDFDGIGKIILGSDDGTAQVTDKLNERSTTLEGPADWIGVAVIPVRDSGLWWRIHRDSSGVVSVWNVNRNVRTLAGPPELLNPIGYAADGRLLLAGYSGGEVLVWDADSGELVKTLVGHTGRVLAAAFSPNGRILATASADGTVRLWAYDAGEELAAFVPFARDGYAILFPDGSYKLDGDPGDTLYWAIKQCRFAPGELDPYVPEIRRLAQGDPTYPVA